MSTIAFIGLGIMGSSMAVHLQQAGTDIVGYDVSPGRGADLVAAGGREAGSIAEAVKDVDVVALMVPDSPDVEAVLTGGDGVFAHAAPGSLVIDFSSIRPDVTAALAGTAMDNGFRLLDAPVSGGEAGAKNAALSIMVGGAPADFVAAEPILDAVGKMVVHVGGNGAGQTVKAANQLIVGANIQVLAEALVFLEASASTPTPRCRCSAGGWPARRCSTRRSRTCWLERSSRASGSTCIIGTWAS